MTELSERLRAVADLVDDGMVVADIGTDHGYIPIALVQEGRCPRAVAMDIISDRLTAQEHIFRRQSFLKRSIQEGLTR